MNEEIKDTNEAVENNAPEVEETVEAVEETVETKAEAENTAEENAEVTTLKPQSLMLRLPLLELSKDDQLYSFSPLLIVIYFP